MVVAQSEEAYRRLAVARAPPRLEREYLALVRGRPRSRTGRIEAAIGRDRVEPTRQSLDTDTPRDAITHFEVAELLPRHALLARAARDGPHAPDPRPPRGDRPPGGRRRRLRRRATSASTASSCMRRRLVFPTRSRASDRRRGVAAPGRPRRRSRARPGSPRLGRALLPLSASVTRPGGTDEGRCRAQPRTGPVPLERRRLYDQTERSDPCPSSP